MKKLLIVLISFVTLYANSNSEYYILKNSITLGKINDFSTINDGYLIAKPTNKVLKWFISWNHYVLYEKDKKPYIQGEIKYKKDKYFLLSLVRELTKNRPKDKLLESKKYKLIIKCNGGKCNYTKINKKTQISSLGFLNFSNNSLEELYDEASQISFKRID